MNALGLVGAIIGIVAIFTIWVSASLLFWSVDFNLIDLINKAENTTLIAGCWLFLIGAILCIVSPLGGVLELSGVALFMMWFTSEMHGDMPSNIGPYIGIVSGIIALISIAIPIGPGLMSGSAGLKNRLLVFSSDRGA